MAGHTGDHRAPGTTPGATYPPAACRVAGRRGIPAVLCFALMASNAAYALDLPDTHEAGEMLHPGRYACADGTTPTVEFDILDGTAYFLRGSTLRAGDFAYDKAAGRIDWKTGPFAGNGITAYNTVRIADGKPAVIMHYEAAGEAPSTEYCTIVE